MIGDKFIDREKIKIEKELHTVFKFYSGDFFTLIDESKKSLFVFFLIMLKESYKNTYSPFVIVDYQLSNIHSYISFNYKNVTYRVSKASLNMFFPNALLADINLVQKGEDHRVFFREIEEKFERKGKDFYKDESFLTLHKRLHKINSIYETSMSLYKFVTKSLYKSPSEEEINSFINIFKEHKKIFYILIPLFQKRDPDFTMSFVKKIIDFDIKLEYEELMKLNSLDNLIAIDLDELSLFEYTMKQSDAESLKYIDSMNLSKRLIEKLDRTNKVYTKKNKI